MLSSFKVIKAVRRWWLLVGIAVFSLTVGLYFLKRPLLSQQVHSRPSETDHSGTPASTTSEPAEPTLHVTSIAQHGRIVEIHGTTDPGAIVMINGQPAATIFAGSEFRHFVGPLPAGTSIVTVTSQNYQGGVNTQQMAVTVE
jgi:hypothetical protein